MKRWYGSICEALLFVNNTYNEEDPREAIIFTNIINIPRLYLLNLVYYRRNSYEE
jgi:hypothetical protein